jgi:ribosomal protein S18 acetylase RimI-like enzyme
MIPNLEISWCGVPDRGRELATFFATNIDPSYISHSELQGLRALSPEEWRSDLRQILEDEITLRLRQLGTGTPSAVSRPVLIAERNGSLVALSLVTFAGNAPVPFAVIEDFVVDPPRRSRGIGKTVCDWIAAEAVARNIYRLFLESGVTNNRAHEFFEREGFKICSFVMMRSLNSSSGL